MNRASALRLSLLVSIGAIPAACGGTVVNRHDGDGDAGSGNAVTGQGGSSGKTPSGPGKMLPPGPGTGGTGISMGGSFGIAGAEGHPMTKCTSPKYDAHTGLVACAEGYRYRPMAVACGALTGQGGESAALGGAGGVAAVEEPNLPRANGSVDCSDNGAGGAGPVDSDSCHAFEHGYCKYYAGGYGPAGFAGGSSVCESGCSTDAECGPGSVCLCDEPDSPTGGACRPSNCRTDANCADGYRCASYGDACGGPGAFACQGPSDECLGPSATCADCEWSSFEGKRTCGGCAVPGRPFLVESQARLAPVVSRGDWLADASSTPRLDHLTKSERAALAEHWTKAGQMEHASIAAFARFSLQLLALGAPPELVEACTAALADETAHTKLCFGIASAYAGRAIGPGPLDVSRSLEVTSLVDIVDLVIAEGCFGETSAALEALEAADSAADPVIVAAYSQIAQDEQRHAELAFRFVRWALERGGEDVAERVAAAITTPPQLGAAAFGVAVPCLRALLTPPAPAAARASANLPAI
jgi:hypothetical protein